MREILFRGKRKDNEEWAEGCLLHDSEQNESYIAECFEDRAAYIREVIPETVGQYIGLTDKNGKKIFEGDIVNYNTFNDFDCQSVVKFGQYEQDGSGGEYGKVDCIGFYIEVDNFTCPDWCEDEPYCFPDYLKQQNILEVAKTCEVIGNIHDTPELLKGGE